jgi:hypothetical protein
MKLLKFDNFRKEMTPFFSRILACMQLIHNFPNGNQFDIKTKNYYYESIKLDRMDFIRNRCAYHAFCRNFNNHWQKLIWFRTPR